MTELKADCGLTRVQVEEYLGIGTTMFYELFNNDEFPNAYYTGTSIRVPLGDLKRYRRRKNYKKCKPKDNFKRG